MRFADILAGLVLALAPSGYVEPLPSDDIVHAAIDQRRPAGHADVYAFTIGADPSHAYDVREATHSWAFSKRFRRMPDGSPRNSSDEAMRP